MLEETLAMSYFRSGCYLAWCTWTTQRSLVDRYGDLSLSPRYSHQFYTAQNAMDSALTWQVNIISYHADKSFQSDTTLAFDLFRIILYCRHRCQ